MKKFFKFIFLIALALGIFYGCKYLKDNEIIDEIKDKIDDSSQNGNKNDDLTDDKKDELEEKLSKIPDEWKDMFKLNNYYVHEYWNFFGNHNEYYHIEDGVIYKLEGSEYKKLDEEKNWKDIDYTLYYDDFEYDETNKLYKARGIILHYENGDSSPADIDIYVDENNRISMIVEDQAISSSLHYTRAFEYSYDIKTEE